MPPSTPFAGHQMAIAGLTRFDLLLQMADFADSVRGSVALYKDDWMSERRFAAGHPILATAVAADLASGATWRQVAGSLGRDEGEVFASIGPKVNELRDSLIFGSRNYIASERRDIQEWFQNHAPHCYGERDGDEVTSGLGSGARTIPEIHRHLMDVGTEVSSTRHELWMMEPRRVDPTSVLDQVESRLTACWDEIQKQTRRRRGPATLDEAFGAIKWPDRLLSTDHGRLAYAVDARTVADEILIAAGQVVDIESGPGTLSLIGARLDERAAYLDDRAFATDFIVHRPHSDFWEQAEDFRDPETFTAELRTKVEGQEATFRRDLALQRVALLGFDLPGRPHEAVRDPMDVARELDQWVAGDVVRRDGFPEVRALATLDASPAERRRDAVNFAGDVRLALKTDRFPEGVDRGAAERLLRDLGLASGPSFSAGL